MGGKPKMPKMPEMPGPSAAQKAQEEASDRERRTEVAATQERARRLGGVMNFQAPVGASETSNTTPAKKPPIKKPKK